MPHAEFASELVEHSELEYCVQRTRKGVSLDPTFAEALACHVAGMVRNWDSGCVVIAAAPGTLGLLREVVQSALPEGVTLKAVAKDYVALSAPELSERLHF